MSELTEQKNRLIVLAAGILNHRLPEYRDDYPKSVPNYIVDGIKKHNKALRVMAIDIRDVADKISKLNNE